MEAEVFYVNRCLRCGREWTDYSLPPAICERNHDGDTERLELVSVRQVVEVVRKQIDTSPPLENFPPIIVHSPDIGRLGKFGMKHNLGDSAITLRFALDCLEALNV